VYSSQNMLKILGENGHGYCQQPHFSVLVGFVRARALRAPVFLGPLTHKTGRCAPPALPFVHKKKVIVFPVPSRYVIDQTLPGREYFNYSRPGRLCLVTSRLVTRKTITFFYSVASLILRCSSPSLWKNSEL
jgi:hypothetical protein